MIKIRVCCGTSCYIMGASDLISMDLNDDGVEMEGTTCMDLCKNSSSRPPYVTINGQLYSSVTPEKLSLLIKEATDERD